MKKVIYLGAFLLLFPGSCGRSEISQMLPGFEDEYGQVEAKWLAEILRDCQSDGVYVLEATGKIRIQSVGGEMSPPFSAELIKKERIKPGAMEVVGGVSVPKLKRPIILVEESTVSLDLVLCYMLSEDCGPERTWMFLWNRKEGAELLPLPRNSHAPYPFPVDDGFLQIESWNSPEGESRYRFGHFNASRESQLSGWQSEKYVWDAPQMYDGVLERICSQYDTDQPIRVDTSPRQSAETVLNLLSDLRAAGFPYVVWTSIAM